MLVFCLALMRGALCRGWFFCDSVTLFKSSLFTNGSMDSVQIWTGVYLGTKFSIPGGIFLIRSVYRSRYRFSILRWFSPITRHVTNGSQRKSIEGVLKRTIWCGRSNFPYISSVLMRNRYQDIDFSVYVGVTLSRGFSVTAARPIRFKFGTMLT